MRRFLKTRVSLVVLAILAISLTAGVVWAAGGSGPRPQGFVLEVFPEVVVAPMVVEAGTPALKVYGSGFPYDASRPVSAGDTVFMEINRGDNSAIFLGSELANENGAVELVVSELSASIEPGIYSVTARSLRMGLVFTYPLVVVVGK